MRPSCVAVDEQIHRYISGVMEAHLDDSHQGGEHHGHLHPPSITGLHIQDGGRVGSISGLHVKHGVWSLPDSNAPDHQTDYCKGACKSHTSTLCYICQTSHQCSSSVPRAQRAS